MDYHVKIQQAWDAAYAAIDERTRSGIHCDPHHVNNAKQGICDIALGLKDLLKQDGDGKSLEEYFQQRIMSLRNGHSTRTTKQLTEIGARKLAQELHMIFPELAQEQGF